jgi:hypothetical protein
LLAHRADYDQWSRADRSCSHLVPCERPDGTRSRSCRKQAIGCGLGRLRGDPVDGRVDDVFALGNVIRAQPHRYHELLAAELPLRAAEFGSSPRAFERTLVQSAAVNWHLFETIDILKHSGGAVEQYPTSLLDMTPPLRSRFCTEGLAVPGVPKPLGPPGPSPAPVTWCDRPDADLGYL